MKMTPESIAAGIEHLRKQDKVLRRVIDEVGPFKLRLHRDRFQALANSIISQQISGSAADSIQAKLIKLLEPDGLKPDALLRFTLVELRTAGVSPQKGGYLLDLAQKVASGEVRLQRLARCPDEAVIAELTKIKGIGVWTAQMFLMFSLGRPDVFPHGDLGVRNAIRNLYQLPEAPDMETSHKIAEPWRPYATIASWYLWRSLDMPREQAKLNKKKL